MSNNTADTMPALVCIHGEDFSSPAPGRCLTCEMLAIAFRADEYLKQPAAPDPALVSTVLLFQRHKRGPR
jgi:hypothetical protein